MSKKYYGLVTVLDNGRFLCKCSPARARRMLERKEVKVVNIDPFIVNKIKTKNFKNFKRFKIK